MPPHALGDALLARFPRDAAALGRAADHFQKNGDRTRERTILAQLAALDPTDLPRLLRLGALQLEAGDRVAARHAWETLLEHSEPRTDLRAAALARGGAGGTSPRCGRAPAWR